MMPILLTAQNVDIVLGDHPDRLRRIIPQIFEQLLEPSLDDFTRYTYCVRFSTLPSRLSMFTASTTSYTEIRS